LGYKIGVFVSNHKDAISPAEHTSLYEAMFKYQHKLPKFRMSIKIHTQKTMEHEATCVMRSHSRKLPKLLVRRLIPETESKLRGVHQGQQGAAIEGESSWDTALERVSIYRQCQLGVY
jgi:hypothetical protein